jgi:hypothetical protein
LAFLASFFFWASAAFFSAAAFSAAAFSYLANSSALALASA